MEGTPFGFFASKIQNSVEIPDITYTLYMSIYKNPEEKAKKVKSVHGKIVVRCG